MKYVLIVVIGFLMGLLFALYINNNNNANNINTDVVSDIKLYPVYSDTIYISKPYPKIITYTKYDTLNTHDTIYVSTGNIVVKTDFNYEPKEFSLSLSCYGKSVTDSVVMSYKMKENYINTMINYNKPEPNWHKYVWFSAGALFTGGIFYLVK